MLEVVTSILSIDRDTQCGLSVISQAASVTDRTIKILHSLEMVQQIQSITQNVIVASPSLFTAKNRQNY